MINLYKHSHKKSFPCEYFVFHLEMVNEFGFQVKRTDQTWISATPIPNTILVNTGDLLEFWSGGHFPATVFYTLFVYFLLLEGNTANKKIQLFT
jgi:2OG-Fe(II) oxygenase superfamily